MMEVTWGSCTDAGRRRARNEDAFLAEPPVFAVADGMGGHAKGDVAALLAVNALRRLAGAEPGRSDVLDAVRTAHTIISEQAGTTDGLGMGTTLCGLAVASELGVESLLVFNVGDSRVYRLRGRHLTQLTHDHSVVQELVDAGTVRPSEAATHPERHVVTRSLGSGGVLDIDWWSLEPTVGDRYLLCSDGLVKELDPEEVRLGLDPEASPQEAADRLLAGALAAGGRDNITVVVVDVTAAPDPVQLAGLDADTNPRLLREAPTRPTAGSGPAAPPTPGPVASEATP